MCLFFGFCFDFIFSYPCFIQFNSNCFRTIPTAFKWHFVVLFSDLNQRMFSNGNTRRVFMCGVIVKGLPNATALNPILYCRRKCCWFCKSLLVNIRIEETTAYVKRNTKLPKLYLEFCRSMVLEEIHYLLMQIISREAPLMAYLETHATTSFLHNFALNMLKEEGGRYCEYVLRLFVARCLFLYRSIYSMCLWLQCITVMYIQSFSCHKLLYFYYNMN